MFDWTHIVHVLTSSETIQTKMDLLTAVGLPGDFKMMVDSAYHGVFNYSYEGQKEAMFGLCTNDGKELDCVTHFIGETGSAQLNQTFSLENHHPVKKAVEVYHDNLIKFSNQFGVKINILNQK